jgi:hypothetical protein
MSAIGLERPDAEEFSQSLEQIGEGWFRQLALGIKLGAPEALGLARREWSDRIRLKVRDRAERINIETELAAEGLSNRAIADVLGVHHDTVNRDLGGGNPPPVSVMQESNEDDNGENPPRADVAHQEALFAANEETRRAEDAREQGRRDAVAFVGLIYRPALAIARRNLNKGQQAILLAKIYPAPEMGRGKKDAATKLAETADFSSRRLQEAREIVRRGANAVRDGTVKLDIAVAQVKAEQSKLISAESLAPAKQAQG